MLTWPLIQRLTLQNQSLSNGYARSLSQTAFLLSLHLKLLLSVSSGYIWISLSLKIKMHRAYQPITPANNKLLKKRWDMSSYNTHRRKVCFCSVCVQNYFAAQTAVGVYLLLCLVWCFVFFLGSVCQSSHWQQTSPDLYAFASKVKEVTGIVNVRIVWIAWHNCAK